MKKILGLDLGTNSIGWALIENDFNTKAGKIIGMGSRIIPMSQDIINDFESGNSVSQTAQRTTYRSIRRLRERHILRRERIHRVLQLMEFLPEEYAKQIDWHKAPGKFINGKEPKLAYGKNGFLFKESFQEMVSDFESSQPELLANDRKIPYDWTIYYLRKKALIKKISKEELSWILLNFNQKRGYYQLRGEEEDDTRDNKKVEFHELKVTSIESTGDIKGDSAWYNVVLENGWIYRRQSRSPLNDWIGKTKEFIVTTELNKDGTPKTDSEGNVKRTFRAPKEDDWTLEKTRTEKGIQESGMTVGEYIYEHILQNPKQKIRGKLIRTIERKLYKEELRQILMTQVKFHEELKDPEIFSLCVNELYPNNLSHKNNIRNRDFIYLFIDDIIFYQRPLKSKKSLIADCRFEKRTYIDQHGQKVTQGVKGIPKSHPLFQEFRIWQWIQNLRIFEREAIIDGKPVHDHPVTEMFLKDSESCELLFEFLSGRNEIKQKALLKYFKLSYKTHRWNYVDDPDKAYPCNATRSLLTSRMVQVRNLPEDFLTPEIEEKLWHIIYSVTDKDDYLKAIHKFKESNSLDDSFVTAFSKLPAFEKEYASYSAKALKKILPLMRCGIYWNRENIDMATLERINKIIDGEDDEKIQNKVREEAIKLTSLEDFSFLPLWLATYIVYNRHAENESSDVWNNPDAVKKFLNEEFSQHSLRNPIVEQVVSETLKVVCDIWDKYGDGEKGFFDEIHVELGREMKNNADERSKISKRQLEEENTNLRIKALLMELAEDPEIKEVRPASPYQHQALKIFEDGINKSVNLPADIDKISKTATPSKNDIIRYKAWLEQGYRSPYTGEVIPLSRLFTSDYQIEHIIPQARYFDDSFTNKVICESEVNKLKDKLLGYQFIREHGGSKVELGQGKFVKVFTEDEYIEFLNFHYRNNPAKKRKLLMDEIPEKMIERQLNDTRYISKYIIGLLSNIVREEGELDHRSKNLIPCTGKITSVLKQDWGLNDVWNEMISPRFKRLNLLTNEGSSEEGLFGQYVHQNGNRFFLPRVPIEFQKGFQKKRIDHRHHAVDALVVACATANHVNFLNNESHIRKNTSKEERNKIRFDLRNKLKKIETREIKDPITGERREIKTAKEFLLPWEKFTFDTKEALKSIVVSHKHNLRVINKTVNRYQKYVPGNDGMMKKAWVKQEMGENWAIRKALHKETVYGKVLIYEGKEISLKKALDATNLVFNAKHREILETLLRECNNDKTKALNTIKKHNFNIPGKIRVFTEGTASRMSLDSSFNEDKIVKKVTDKGIQKILMNHLNDSKYQGQTDEKGQRIPPEQLAFSPEGIEDMNYTITALNDGKPHQPIYKVRVWEAGNRFNLGETSNKKAKFVEAAKGTNLYFAIYQVNETQRNYETVPLNEVIAHQKLDALRPKDERSPVPVRKDLGRFLFSLSPNDLVYVPTDEEIENPHIVDFNNLTHEQVNRIYKMISCTGSECYFIQNSIASLIKSYDSKSKIGEFESKNKMEKAITGEIIKTICWKLKINRIGKIIAVIR